MPIYSFSINLLLKKKRRWVRGNFFIPDARCWWVKPSVKYLKAYLKDHPVDAIISTGPPHSMHLIAMKLKGALRLPWIADFRDPWTEIDYYNDLHLTRWADRKHHRLEHEVLTKADKVVTVAPDGARRLENLGAKDVVTIYNGFDRDDNTQLTVEASESFTLTYLGVLSKVQNPENFWQAMGELVQANPTFRDSLRIKMIGQIDQSVVQSIKTHGLDEYTVFSPYIPHDKVSAAHRNSTALLLFLMPDSEPRSKGLLTGKLFEYLASGRPILCIGPEDGDAAKILSETHAGTTVCFDDKDKMKAELTRLFQLHKANQLPTRHDDTIERYSRRALAGEYAKLLNQSQP